MKKNRFQKSHATVPLKEISHESRFVFLVKGSWYHGIGHLRDFNDAGWSEYNENELVSRDQKCLW